MELKWIVRTHSSIALSTNATFLVVFGLFCLLQFCWNVAGNLTVSYSTGKRKRLKFNDAAVRDFRSMEFSTFSKRGWNLENIS